MLGVNKVILIGNSGKDPELRRTPGGSSVASFPLATTERFNDRNGERQERTEWHNIVVWGRQAEIVNQYVRKGRPVYVEGRLTTRSWDDRDGNKKYRTEVVANTVQFLGSGGGQGEERPQPSSQPDFAGVAENAPNMDQAPVEDDLPF